jgi:hypothetical protein
MLLLSSNLALKSSPTHAIIVSCSMQILVKLIIKKHLYRSQEKFHQLHKAHRKRSVIFWKIVLCHGHLHKILGLYRKKQKLAM